MPTPSLPDYAFAGGPADGFGGRGWRMSRPAVVVSIVAHIAVLFAASQLYETEPARIAATFEWVTAIEAPSEPVVQPPLDVVEPVMPLIAPAPPLRTVVPREVSPPAVAPPEPEAPVERPTAP